MLRLDGYLVRELTAESLSVERHGAGTRDNFDVLELQGLATRRQRGGAFDLPPAGTIPENHLRSFGLGKPVIAPFLERQVGRKKITALAGQ